MVQLNGSRHRYDIIIAPLKLMAGEWKLYIYINK